VLWEPPPPRLTALVTDVQHEPHGTHQHVELTLHVVNNGDRELTNLTLGVQIQGPRPGPPGSEDAPVERTLHVPALGPGHQLRWTTRGRGDRFELRMPELGRLDEDGIDAAPADRFLALAASPRGAASLHAGSMLAFLGDPRARDTLLRLRQGRSARELAWLERVLESTLDLRVCQLQVSPRGNATRIQSCLYNAGETQQTDFELEIRAVQPELPAESPAGAHEPLLRETLAWPGSLAAHRGRRLELTLNLGQGKPSAERRVELIARQKEARE
jgi:hypothetical protein